MKSKRRKLIVLAILMFFFFLDQVELIVKAVVKKNQIINKHYEVYPTYPKIPLSTEKFRNTTASNWAVVVGTSRYFHNYRHTANALSMYRSLKKLGMPDDRIILMLADETSCNPRNIYPGKIFGHRSHEINLSGDDVEVDFRGDEVTVDNFLRLLSGRQAPWVPRNRRLDSDSSSRIFIYLTGHGGDRFIKFRDAEIITSADISNSLRHMHEQRRYNEIMFVSDTCQAATLQHEFTVPNVIAVGSSRKDESSYSHHIDRDIGVAMIDRFTFYAYQFLHKLDIEGNETLHDLLEIMDEQKLKSLPEVRCDLFSRNTTETRMNDFISSTEEPILNSKTLRLSDHQSKVRFTHLGDNSFRTSSFYSAHYGVFTEEKKARKIGWQMIVNLAMHVFGLSSFISV